MKKSEMIKNMGDWLASELDIDQLQANTICKGLLYFQEEIGMLPPKSKHHKYCNKQLTEFYQLHKWELEE